MLFPPPWVDTLMLRAVSPDSREDARGPPASDDPRDACQLSYALVLRPGEQARPANPPYQAGVLDNGPMAELDIEPHWSQTRNQRTSPTVRRLAGVVAIFSIAVIAFHTPKHAAHTSLPDVFSKATSNNASSNTSEATSNKASCRTSSSCGSGTSVAARSHLHDYNEMCISQVCPVRLYKRLLRTGESARDENINQKLLKAIGLYMQSDKFLEDHPNSCDRAHFVDGYTQFKQLYAVSAEDVLAFRETWSDEDTEILHAIDSDTRGFVPHGDFSTEAFASSLPSLQDSKR